MLVQLLSKTGGATADLSASLAGGVTAGVIEISGPTAILTASTAASSIITKSV